MNKAKLIANSMDERIESFIKKQTVVSIAVISDKETPYCASCFYAYDDENKIIIFKSDTTTNHIHYALENNKIAGTILPDSLNKAAIKGIQFEGELYQHEKLGERASIIYHKKYPFAKIMYGEVWMVAINSVKFTDNTLMFGKKLLWDRA